MKRVCLQCGHWGIENLTSDSLRSWRDVTYLKTSTGASGERDYFFNKVIPLLRDKLISAGIQVYIAGATYSPEIYSSEYDLWISFHYDGGGVGERCMISAPNRTTTPAYLHQTAQSEAERFCSVWKSIYPNIVNVPNNDGFISDGMKDYYAYDYVGYDTPAVLIEHFNHTSPRGTILKTNPDLVAEGDFKAICNFLGVSETPVVVKEVYQIVYKGTILQEYEFNPTDKINEMATQIEAQSKTIVVSAAQVGVLTADITDLNETIGTKNKALSEMTLNRDEALVSLQKAQFAMTGMQTELKVANDRIKAFESADPLAPYTARQLISLGMKKLWAGRR